VNRDKNSTEGFPHILNKNPDASAPTRDPEIYDFAVIGAGGAGMCILLQFLKRPFFKNKRILVIEPNAKTANDRTWCFWTLPEETPYQELIALADYRWDKFRLPNGQVENSDYQYHHIPSIELYKEVHRLAEQHPFTDWIGEQVLETEKLAEGILIKTQKQDFIASLVFDSRFDEEQVNLLKGPETIWQSFIGWKIKLKDPTSNRDTVSLMDFDVLQSGNTQFIYYLPFDDNEALVELTRFGKSCVDEAEAKTLIHSWITENYGEYQVLDKEEGRIPMVQGLEKEVMSEGMIIPIGTAAGAVKSTTGYAIKKMFKHSYQIAEAIENKQKSPTIDQEQRFHFYDSLLLKILQDKPEKGKQVFEQLFEQNSINTIFKFLDEKTKLREEIPLLLSLPIPEFLSALYRKHAPKSAFSGRRFSSEIKILLLLLLTVGLFQLNIIDGQSLTFLMLIGLIFPGIPHGAMDHCLGKGGKLKGMGLVKFVGKYLMLMALILALWLWNASLGVALFILYSAWHFGETDLREWGMFGRLKAVVFGLGTLSVILFSHPVELEQMLYLLKAENFADLTLPYYGILEITAWILVLLPLLKISSSQLHSFLLLVFILFMGRFLPLVPAFLWYFIAWHSYLGWLHIKKLSGNSHFKLLKQSMPFTLGAFAVFIALYLFFPELTTDPARFIPYIFIFLAAISAPHILFMHLYYLHNERA